MDIEVILHSDNTVETDIYYNYANAHDYLPYNSAHPKHCNNNLPYNLAKRIIVFVSNEEKVEMRLKELKNWLMDCNYPVVSLINPSMMHNYKGQNPLQIIRKTLILLQLIMKIKIMKKWSGKFILNDLIFNQDTFQKYLKIKKLFFPKSNPKNRSNY